MEISSTPDVADYGQTWATVYDERFAGKDPSAEVALLAELAGTGPALELGIGTGRVALPLAGRGVAVYGIDASESMVARLREKPGGAAIPVTIGDFEAIPLDGPFTLVYVVFNTFFGLLSQDAQVRCFQSVAGRLQPGGRFLIEAFVPDLGRFRNHQDVRTVRLDDDIVDLAASMHDLVTQRVDARNIFISGGAVDVRPTSIRYAWPAELDLMARIAGLGLEARWGGWRREPFTPASGFHVSVYQRP